MGTFRRQKNLFRSICLFSIQRSETPMKLLTIKEISEKWGLSERTIRKLCVEERIPEAELIRGIWMIPEDAYKPERKPPQKQEKQTVPLSPLARQVISQRRRNNHYGIYEHI